jgi:hypothetical protein
MGDSAQEQRAPEISLRIEDQVETAVKDWVPRKKRSSRIGRNDKIGDELVDSAIDERRE